jgi:DNA end-binding protein Ku
MAGATIWKGNIRFSDTEVPVKLHTAVNEVRVSFHLLHKTDQVRLRQQMICAFDKQPVSPEEQAKGFELEEGKYLIIDPEELEQIAAESSRTIEVHEFVPKAQIDPFSIDRVYYLEPDESESKADGFSALAKILSEAGVVGICTWNMRKRSYFGALQAAGKKLRLCTLRYVDEVVSVETLGLQKIAVSEKELSIGSDLIGKLSGPFEPAKFENEHQKKLQDMIEKKARGEHIEVITPARVSPTESDKLLEALEASLKKAA